MTNSFPDIQNNLSQLIECYVEKTQTSIANDHAPHTYVTEPNSQATYFLEPKSIHTYIDVATEIQKPLLNAHTFFLQDLSNHQQTPYNSLIFEIDGHCFKSKDTTSQIIERFGTHNDKPYEFIQTIGQLIGVTQKCPYVIGDIFLAPDRETSKNEANWLGLHHVIDTESRGEDTYFLFKNHHELILYLNDNAVNNMIERAFLLYRFEKIFLQLAFIKSIEISANIMGVSHLTAAEIEKYYHD